jgi:hypothetical protein
MLRPAQHAVRNHLDRMNRKLIAELIEIESSQSPDRPKLTKTLKSVSDSQQSRIIACDRLSRPPKGHD